jgi:Uma2 family endonuclease
VSPDVAAISRERWEAVDPDDDLYGTPVLVIEVKWPFNTLRQLRELVSICLNKNTAEFWILDPKRKSVTVVRRDGTPVVFEAGSTLSLAAFGGGELPVDEIFA